MITIVYTIEAAFESEGVKFGSKLSNSEVDKVREGRDKRPFITYISAN